MREVQRVRPSHEEKQSEHCMRLAHILCARYGTFEETLRTGHGSLGKNRNDTNRGDSAATIGTRIVFQGIFTEYTTLPVPDRPNAPPPLLISCVLNPVLAEVGRLRYNTMQTIIIDLRQLTVAVYTYD